MRDLVFAQQQDRLVGDVGAPGRCKGNHHKPYAERNNNKRAKKEKKKFFTSNFFFTSSLFSYS